MPAIARGAESGVPPTFAETMDAFEGRGMQTAVAFTYRGLREQSTDPSGRSPVEPRVLLGGHEEQDLERIVHPDGL